MLVSSWRHLMNLFFERREKPNSAVLQPETDTTKVASFWLNSCHLTFLVDEFSSVMGWSYFIMGMDKQKSTHPFNFYQKPFADSDCYFELFIIPSWPSYRWRTKTKISQHTCWKCVLFQRNQVWIFWECFEKVCRTSHQQWSTEGIMNRSKYQHVLNTNHSSFCYKCPERSTRTAELDLGFIRSALNERSHILSHKTALSWP